MSQTYPCFWLEESDRDRLSLRRYRSGSEGEPKCPFHGYHNAFAPFGEADAKRSDRGYRESHGDLAPAHDDPRWASIGGAACGPATSASSAGRSICPTTINHLSESIELIVGPRDSHLSPGGFLRSLAGSIPATQVPVGGGDGTGASAAVAAQGRQARAQGTGGSAAV